MHTDVFVLFHASLLLFPLAMSYYLPTSQYSTCVSYVHVSVMSFDGITLQRDHDSYQTLFPSNYVHTSEVEPKG